FGYTRAYGICPVERRGIEVVDEAVRAFEEAGVHVEEVDIGITRSQRELSDVWCRFIAVNQVRALDGFKHQGIDLLRDHRAALPPQLIHWDDMGGRMTAPQSLRRCECLRRKRRLRAPQAVDGYLRAMQVVRRLAGLVTHAVQWSYPTPMFTVRCFAQRRLKLSAACHPAASRPLR